MKNNNLYDTFYMKFLADESRNFHNFHLTQWIMSNDFDIDKAIKSSPELLNSEINFMRNCTKLTLEEFSNLRINLLRNLNT